MNINIKIVIIREASMVLGANVYGRVIMHQWRVMWIGNNGALRSGKGKSYDEKNDCT